MSSIASVHGTKNSHLLGSWFVGAADPLGEVVEGVLSDCCVAELDTFVRSANDEARKIGVVQSLSSKLEASLHPKRKRTHGDCTQRAAALPPSRAK